MKKWETLSEIPLTSAASSLPPDEHAWAVRTTGVVRLSRNMIIENRPKIKELDKESLRESSENYGTFPLAKIQDLWYNEPCKSHHQNECASYC